MLGSLPDEFMLNNDNLLSYLIPMILWTSKKVSISCFEIFLDEIKDLFEEEDENEPSNRTLDEVTSIDIINSINIEDDLKNLF